MSTAVTIKGCTEERFSVRSYDKGFEWGILVVGIRLEMGSFIGVDRVLAGHIVGEGEDN